MKNKWVKIGITNIVTMIRAVGIFALIPAFKIYGGFTCFLVSAGCFATDFVDGFLARKLDASTFFGSLFDGVSDKLFLIASMFLLLNITPLAIIPLIFELGIAGVQTLKYKSNLKVKSNMIGKAKMWVAGVIISLCYLLVDPVVLNYFSADLVTKLDSVSKIKLFSAVLSPLVLSEVATLTSYIKEFKHELKEYQENPQIKIEDDNQKQELAKDIDEKTLGELLFDHEFYQKYQDSTNLMDITSEVLTRKRVKK